MGMLKQHGQKNSEKEGTGSCSMHRRVMPDLWNKI